MSIDFKALLNLAVSAAKRAGKLLDSSHDSISTVNSEKKHDVKLKADVESERLIIDFLTQNSPYAVLSEESGETEGEDGVYKWIVDPLDGTINYLHRIPMCCVSIALWKADEPVLGVIYDIPHNQTYKAIVGQGAWADDESITVSKTAEKDRAILTTGFPSGADLSDNTLKEFVTSVQEFRKLRLIGSAALSLAFVACGKMDAYKENGIMIWDVAAGLALVKAAGGTYSLNKTSLKNKYDVYASNGLI